MRVLRRPAAAALCATLVAAAASRAAAQVAPPGPCTSSHDSTSARTWLARARSAVGLTAAGDSVIRIVESIEQPLADESDRPDPPYIGQITSDTVWVDPATGVERVRLPGPRGATYLRGARATFRVGPDGATGDAGAHSRLWGGRAFDVWAELEEWARDARVAVGGRCQYRAAMRIVLTRPGAFGAERLLLDEQTAIPIALERTEAHYFLGPYRARYLYATWTAVGARALYPVTATLMVDGEPEETRSAFPGAVTLVGKGEAPPVAIPDSSLVLPIEPQHRFRSDSLTPVAVGGGTYLLVNRAFTSVASLAGDTVFLFDSPAGEVRARNERVLLDSLFAGRHPVVFVAMNHVWPHIAGMRYWVAHGATVVTSAANVSFVRSVLARRWAALPDELEAARARTRITVRGISDSASLAGGAVRLFPLEGTNGEGQLLAYLAPAHFVWASDHIQDISAPNIYVEDVRRTVRRHALAPAGASGPHFKLIPWASVDTLPHERAGDWRDADR